MKLFWMKKKEIVWMKRNKSWTLVPTEECATKCDWQMSFCLSGTFEVRKKVKRKKSETKRKEKSERRERSIEIELKYKRTVFI
jgi:hypothetical protein